MRDPQVSATATPPTERTITLTMNEDVARTLLDLTEYVYGGERTYASHTNAVGAALREAGVTAPDDDGASPSRFSGAASVGAWEIEA